MRMIVFMDGGSQKQENSKHKFVLSYGIVAHHQDTTVELHGSKTNVHHVYNGHHELYAFVEAVIYANSHNSLPDEVSFYTDDAMVCNVNYFHTRNGNMHGNESALDKLYRFCAEHYSLATYRLCEEYLKFARFTKVKGHSRTVYNLRCDYLAAHSRSLTKGTTAPLLEFEDWLREGFVFYDGGPEAQVWYPPFANTQE